MFENVFSIPIALFFLSFLIFIHELAHFLAGKAVGIHAEVFSIGFGPALFSITRGGTEYRLAIIPAGGYVKFPGEYSEDAEGRLDGDFHESAIWRRAIVVAAGPLSNLVLGVLVFAFLAMSGLPDKSMPRVGDVIDTDEKQATYWENPSYQSPAAEAGIVPGDLITAVDGRAVPTWEDFTHEVMIRPDTPTVLQIERDGVSRDITVTPRPVLRGKMTIGRVGIAASQPLVVVDADGEKHRIRSLDGRPVYGYSPFHATARAVESREVALGLASGAERPVKVRTRVLAATSPSPDVQVGDALVAVNGVEARTLEDARRIVLGSPTEDVVFTFEREDATTAEITTSSEIVVTVAGVDGKRFPAVRKLRLGDSLKAVDGMSVQAYGEVRELLREASPVKDIRLTFEHRSRLLFAKWTGEVDIEAPVRWHDGHLVIPGLTLQSNFSDGQGYFTVGSVTIAEQLEMLDAATDAPLTVGLAEAEKDASNQIAVR